jgi:FkbM family methyltransferase
MASNMAGRAPPHAEAQWGAPQDDEPLRTPRLSRALWDGLRAEPLDTLRKLRPAKLRSALRRRWFERRMVRQDYLPGATVVDLGTSYGGWTVPSDMPRDGWTCYSIGVGGDISFDLEIIRRYGMRVRCVEPVLEYVESARATAADCRSLLVLHAAVATHDGPLRMQQTHIPGSASLSSVQLYDTDDWVEVPGRTLESLMAEMGDSRVELLKVDMEGAEYEWFDHVDLVALGVQVLCVEFHHNASVRTARKLIARLRADGFRPVACRPTINLTFVRE